jgi:hypothetical protein
MKSQAVQPGISIGRVIDSCMAEGPPKTQVFRLCDGSDVALLKCGDDLGAVVLLVEGKVVDLVPTGVAIDESVELAHEIYNRVFRKVPERVMQK